jgi:small GTP-binding protein
MMKYHASFKVCIFGDGGVGKTSLTRRFLTNRFENSTKITLGVDIAAHDIIIEKLRIKLQIWDFGGEDRFKTYLPAYTHGSDGGIFMYDITNQHSLDNIQEWISIFSKNIEEKKGKFPILGVGGKKDLENDRELTLKDAQKVVCAKSLYDIFECSAKTGENVKMIFESITRKILLINKII